MVWVPLIAKVAYTIRNFVIGFFHLVFLGVLTPFLLWLATQEQWFNENQKTTQLGIIVFTIGMLASEVLLFGQGLLFWGNMGLMPAYYELVFLASALIPISFIVLWFSSRAKTRLQTNNILTSTKI